MASHSSKKYEEIWVSYGLANRHITTIVLKDKEKKIRKMAKWQGHTVIYKST